jgi:crotonobetaine/carnitine-CoA ligase
MAGPYNVSQYLYELHEPKKRVFGSILDDKAHKHPDRVYVKFKDQSITYANLSKTTNIFANAYASLGVKKGDCVSIMMPNCIEYLYHTFGCAKLGAIDSPINIAYKGAFLQHVISNSKSEVLLVHEDFLERLKLIEAELPTLKKIVVYSPHDREPEVNFKKFEVLPFSVLFEAPAVSPNNSPISHIDPFDVIYTSGTTGRSKGVVRSHNCVYLYGADIASFLEIKENDVTYNCLPMFHMNHRLTTVYALLLGGSYAIGERFSASKFWDDIREHGCTGFHVLAGMAQFILAQPPTDNDNANPAHWGFGTMNTPEVGKTLEGRFNVRMYRGYFGMTEASEITLLSKKEADDLKKTGRWEQVISMGKENKELYEVKLVDEEDEEMPLGEVGEIVCRPSRSYGMMTEYLNNPEATAQAFRNLWFHTGDLAKKDEDGFFYFVDRKKDYIRRRGENISSFEVEEIFNSNPNVLESAVIGVKSEVAEEEVMAIVKLKEGRTLSPEELTGWCEDKLPYFAVPRFVEFLEELPKTPTGRVRKHELRARGVTKKTWDREKVGYKLKRE